jgi:predicted O-linked N-acetylglucosamine transferase (SPINDLY family)
MRKRLESAFDHFIDVADKTSQEIGLMAREAQIDIAIDLCGFTENARTEIFSLRAAPVQISYVGFLGTMGAEYIDYLIADEVIIPKDLRKFYSEKIMYLPSYQSNDSQRSAGTKEFTKSELGIAENQFVFCNLNNVYKITEPIFNSWLRILSKVENSALLLYSENAWATDNLRNCATKQCINPARLIFTSHLPRADYLAQYAIADLFLDTYPYNAGTTASDALWMGLPVITLQGNSFPSRVASSLLTNLNLPELIHHSIESYEVQAIELASNPIKLNTLKNTLEQNRLIEPLFNIKLFTKHLEQAFSAAHSRHANGLPPEDINLKSNSD